MKRLLFIIYVVALCVSSNAQSDVDTRIAVNDVKDLNTFVLIVSNENYKYEQPVPFALNDGETFKLYCEKTLGIPEKNIRYAGDATLNEMRMQLQWLTKVMKAYDGEARAIVYYSGHGMPSEDGKHAYLLPVDGNSSLEGSGMSTASLYKTLGDMPSQATIVFLDACFSGARRDGQMLASSRGVAIKAKDEPVSGNMVVFSAAQGDETAYPYKEKRHGLFTYYILEQIQAEGGNVSLGELVDNVKKQVGRTSIVENDKSQTPNVTASSTITDWRKWILANKRAYKYEIFKRTYHQRNSKSASRNSSNVQRASVGDPVIPSWMQKHQVGQWIGVAPPTTDENKGRSIALINAILGYLRAQRCGDLKAVVKNHFNSSETTQFGESIKQNFESSLQVAEIIDYSGFELNVSDEYYNSRGEYFVNCRLSDNKQSSNQMTIQRTIQRDISSISDKESIISAKINIVLKLKDEEHTCVFVCKAIDDIVSECHVSLNNIPIRPVNGFDYENVIWNQNHQTNILNFSQKEMGMSLGILQLSAFVLTPFIPQTVSIKSVTQGSTVGTDSKVEAKINFVSDCIAEEMCHPTEISLINISNNRFAITIHDTNMEDVSMNLSKDIIYDKQRKVLLISQLIPTDVDSGIVQLLLANECLYSGLETAASEIRATVSSEPILDTTASQIDTPVSSESKNDCGISAVQEQKLANIGVHWDFYTLNTEKRNKIQNKINPCIIKVGVKEIKQ